MYDLMKHLAVLAIALALTVACGNGAETPPTTTEQPVAAAVSANDSGPEIGDKIGESDAERAAAAEASLAAEAKREAEEIAALAARGVKKIGWEELMPEGEQERLEQMYQSQMAMLYSGGGIVEGSAADTAVQIGTFNTVKELNEQKIRIPGYTVPFEYGAKAEITEFLLVPYFGACIHSPPPPPNQTVFVQTDTPIQLKDLAQAVWIEGTLYAETQTSDLADAAYTIKLDTIEEYQY